MLSLDKDPIKINLPSLSTRRKSLKPSNDPHEKPQTYQTNDFTNLRRKKYNNANFSYEVRQFIQQNAQKFNHTEEESESLYSKKASVMANPQTIRKYPSTNFGQKSKTEPASEFHLDTEKQFNLDKPFSPTNLSPIKKYFSKKDHPKQKKYKKQTYNQMILKDRKSLQQKYLKKSLRKEDRVVVKTYLNFQIQDQNQYSIPKIKRKHNTQSFESQMQPSVKNRNSQNLIKKLKLNSKRKAFFNNLEVQTEQELPTHKSSTLSSAIRIFNSQSLKKSQYQGEFQNHKSIREAYNNVKPKHQQIDAHEFKNSQEKKSDWKQIDPLNLITYFVKVMFSSPSIHASPQISKVKKRCTFLQQHINREGLPPTHEKQLQQFVNNYTAIKLDLSKLFASPNFQIVRQQNSLYFGDIKQIKIHEEQQNTVKVKHGLGVQITNDKIYEGHWKNNMKNGSGLQISKNGKYIGNFSHGKKHGTGQFFWENGEYYSGQWSSNMKHGSGYWKASNGDSYMGQWTNNKVEGYGVHKSHNGQNYQGQFKNFLKHKKGIQTFPNGDKYEGQYWQGYAHGQGKYTWSDKFQYHGQFLQGFRTGKGKLTQLSGQMQGEILYEGQFNRQKAQGQGSLKKPNGDTYVGKFKNSVFHGKGVYRALKDKKIYDGEWQEGIFVEGK